MLDEQLKIFVIDKIALKALSIGLLIYFDTKAQIAFSFTKKVIFLDKYFDFVEVFFKKKVLMLL